MKRNTLNRKLKLTKETVANIEAVDMDDVRAGIGSYGDCASNRPGCFPPSTPILIC